MRAMSRVAVCGAVLILGCGEPTSPAELLAGNWVGEFVTEKRPIVLRLIVQESVASCAIFRSGNQPAVGPDQNSIAEVTPVEVDGPTRKLTLALDDGGLSVDDTGGEYAHGEQKPKSQSAPHRSSLGRRGPPL